MKKLYIARHAKSSWEYYQSDFERGLNKRGLRDAPLMAKEFSKRVKKIDKIISSPAKRAKLTALALAQELGYDEKKIEYIDSIYESTLYNLIMILRSIDESLGSVLLVGHNPALTALINTLSDCKIDNLPTLGIVALKIEKEWKEIDKKEYKCDFFIYPKMFKDSNGTT